MTARELVEYIKTKNRICTLDFPDERKVRRAFRKLKRQGILFIPTHERKGMYTRIEVASDRDVEIYAKQEQKRWESHYFDNLLPLKGKTKDMKFEALMGRMEGVLNEQ